MTRALSFSSSESQSLIECVRAILELPISDSEKIIYFKKIALKNSIQDVFSEFLLIADELEQKAQDELKIQAVRTNDDNHAETAKAQIEQIRGVLKSLGKF